MPELPEVETTKRGIQPHLEGQAISAVIVRNGKFRIPVPLEINTLCAGKTIKAVQRRAKYLLIQLSSGYLLIHLGMSGHLRVVPEQTPPGKHDHIDIQLTNGSALRFCDPRRFGLFVYINENPHQHALLSHLGPEPLSQAFTADYLYQRIRTKAQPIKSVIMNPEVVVGVGNIYAAESLFLTGVHPLSPAKNLQEETCSLLTGHIKTILAKAIEAGGTTLRDFYAFDGKPGYFRLSLNVYGRKNQPCLQCDNPIDALIIGGRNSAFCPQCQPIF